MLMGRKRSLIYNRQLNSNTFDKVGADLKANPDPLLSFPKFGLELCDLFRWFRSIIGAFLGDEDT
jgi:hypothetical protein